MGSSNNAGMNFTNLVIAVPLLTAFVIFVINFMRLPRNPKILNIKFQITILIFYYVLIISVAIYYKNLLDVMMNTHSWIKLLPIRISIIIIFAYAPFIFLHWFGYDDNTQNTEKTADKYENSKLEKIIKEKVKQLQDENKFKNILINGHWGSGKTNFTKNTLSKSINSSIYISCTDYPDMFELVNALVYKSNNFIMRQLIRFSLGKLLSIISKTELRQYIGNKNVIILDEFERLVDYNKIDPMHVVSLIQYLNSEKNCICILVANEGHINNTNQFTNVREKLISYTYHYKIPFDDVIKIIQGSNQIALDAFSNIYQDVKHLYNIDNNIRIIEHLYIKINQIYITHKGFTEFKQKNNNIHITNEEFFALLFRNVLDLINPLYYLYLKNPYNLKAIETLAIRYTSTKKPNEKDTPEEKSENRPSQAKVSTLENYLDNDSIQKLASEYLNTDIISYKNGDNESYDISYDVNYIITNQNFEHIDAKLIKYFLGNEEIVIQLIFHNKEYGYGKTFNQNIKIFMRLFKETFCEDDDQKLINDYFSSINVLEQRFSRLVDDIELPFDYSIVTDYIAYCQYIDVTSQRGNTENIRPVSYNKITYINALIIQSINDSTIDNFKLIIAKLTEYMKNHQNPSEHKQNIISLISELTCTVVVAKSECVDFVKLIKQIINELAKTQKYSDVLIEFMYQSYLELEAASFKNNDLNDKDQIKVIELIKLMVDNLIEEKYNAIRSLDFMYQSYKKIKYSLKLENIERCNENLINLLTANCNTKEFRSQLFMHLSNLNDGDTLVQNFNDNSLPILVNKIKEIYNTTELKQQFINTYKNHAWDIPKQVAQKLQEELNTVTEPFNPTQENPDDK